MTPVQKAYGLLWREMRVSDKPYVREARKILLASINHGEQSEAIAWVRAQYPMTERELSGIGEPSLGAQTEGGATVNSDAREPAPIKCTKDRCYSPVACGGWGYCRELNFGEKQ